MFFLFFSSNNNLFQFVFFILENSFFCTERFLGAFQLLYFFSNFFIRIPDMFFSQLYFQLLHFDLFIDRFKLTAVFYILGLLFILFYQRFRLFHHIFLLVDKLLYAVYFLLNTCLTGIQSLYLIFQVAYFHRQFALQHLIFI